MLSPGLLALAHQQYNAGRYKDAHITCEQVYQTDAYRTDNLLLLGAVHFQLRNYSECIFYNQQAIRIDPNFAEAYGNLGNALKELGDIDGSVQFYLKAIKLKPRFCDAYNNLASAHMQLGQTKQAIETYQMALILNPALVDAHSNLGNLYKAQGKLEEAKKSYLEAIRIKPGFAIAWSNLAGVFKDLGDFTTAIAYYQEAIRLSPEFADAHSNMGNALKAAGKVLEAKASYKEAIRLRPDFAIAHGNLASCYYDDGDMELAVRTYKHAIQLEPNYPDAYNNLGNAYREIGRLEDSIHCYRTALSLKPDHPHAYNNLGNSLKDKGLIKEAIHCYMTACRLMPRFAAAHSNLASILKEQGKVDQAIAHYQEALRIDPKFADAYSNMGNAYKELGKLDDAIKCYSTAIRIKPSFADAYCNLASAYKDGGRVADAITCYRKALSLKPDYPDALANLVHCLAMVCDWETRADDHRKLLNVLSEQVASALGIGKPAASGGAGGAGAAEAKGGEEEHTAVEKAAAAGATLTSSQPVRPCVQPFHALVYNMSPVQQRQLAECYARRALLSVALLDLPTFRFRAKRPQQRLRIGYVSANFGNHPVSHLMQSVFSMHDSDAYEVFCYALSADDQSHWRRNIEAGSEHFKDLSRLQAGDAARLIYGDSIHILINLNGYTKGARTEIFALRPAPIQVQFLGFPGTMGADYMPYMIADKVVVPEELREGYTEKIIAMPHTFMPTDHRQSARDVLDPDKCPIRSDYGVPEDKFVFACFTQLVKIDPDTFDCWMRILSRVPSSVLWLLRFPPLGEEKIHAEAKKRGIGKHRIVFADVAAKDEHLRRAYLADLCLDTPMYNAHTTAADLLWAGTPIITLPGERFSSRVGASLLNAVGLSDMVVRSMEEYEELAVAVALDMDRLWAVRRRLEDARTACPLFDTARWVKSLELSFKMMWSRHEMGLPPADIDVPDLGGSGDSDHTSAEVKK